MIVQRGRTFTAFGCKEEEDKYALHSVSLFSLISSNMEKIIQITLASVVVGHVIYHDKSRFQLR